MTRATLESAINMGLRRAQSRNAPPAQCIADAIELAMEMDRTLFSGVAPAVTQDPADRDEPELPPNPLSISVTQAAITDPTLSDPASDADLSPDPAPPTPSTVVLADARMLDKEISQANSGGRLRVRKLFLGNKIRVSMESLARWANESLPRTISVIPRDVDHEITLELSVRIFPMTGDKLKNEEESSVKITYNHPSLGSDMEVGVPIRVGDVQDGFPEVAEIIGRIKAQAKEMYRKREKFIQGVAPAGPNLHQQHGAVMSAINKSRNAVSRTVSGETHPREGASITFIDDTDESLLRA